MLSEVLRLVESGTEDEWVLISGSAPRSIHSYLGEVEKRPDVLASYEAWQTAKHEVTVARAGYWPTVSLDSNQYTKRVGNAADVNWDTLLTVDVPLFQGGQIQGEVKESKAKEKEAELSYQQLKRQASLDVQNTYTQLNFGLRRRDAFQKALEANEKNYQLQQEDYRVNLVNNLDVLRALEEFQDTQRDFVAVENEVKRLYWKFKVSLGKI